MTNSKIARVSFTDDWYQTIFMLDGKPSFIRRIYLKRKWFDVTQSSVRVYYDDHGHRYFSDAERYYFKIKTDLGDISLELYRYMRDHTRVKVTGE